MSAFDKASIVQLPDGAKAGTLYSIVPTDGSGDFSVTRATTATRVNEQGLIESVAANVPRIDYTNGGCGELLVEPQRTNLAKGVSTYGTSLLVKSDPSTDDSQGVEQTQFAVTTSGTNQAFGDITISCTAETDYYWWAVFESAGTNDVSFALVDDSTTTSVIRYRTDDNSTTAQTGNFAEVAVEDLGGGSYKLSGKLTTASGQTTIAPRIRVLTLTGGSSITANGQVMKVSQIQIEQGFYPTAFIPTSGSTATRNADVISLSGASALLGDSEGSLFVELQSFAADGVAKSLSVNDGTVSNTLRVRFTSGNELGVITIIGGSTNVLITSSGATITDSNKLAFRYALNDYNVYLNGSSIGVDTNANTYSDGTLNSASLDRGGGGEAFYGRIRQLVIFDQALTDSELAAITS